MKIAGSYASLLRGVSQQPPEVRMDGQHTEQVNMLPDPVAGLSRRRGSVFQHASFVPVNGNPPYTPDFVVSTGSGYRKLVHKAGGVEYVILMRQDAVSSAITGNSMPPVLCYNKNTKRFIGVQWHPGYSWNELTAARGVSAAVSCGQYVIFALKQTACSPVTTVVYSPTGATKAVVWIRGGAYSRNFTIRVGPIATFSFPTPTADAVVTPSGDQQIQPAYIANQLATQLSAFGYTNVSSYGSHVAFDLPVGQDVSVSDGGDGSLMRSAGRLVDSVDDLPIMGIPGHVVKIQPAADSWFYMQAIGKASTTQGIQELIWRECAGEKITAIENIGMARVYEDTLYIGMTTAADPTGLGHMPVGDNPAVVPHIAGDLKLNPAHRWMSNPISYLGMFQDRLLVGSGAALSVSGAGDYLNFFRSTMTTVPMNDGFEVIPQGGEDDVMRHSVTYNKNLVIFGDKRQYLVPGTTAFTPVAPNVSIMTAYQNGADAIPVAAGGLIYYARNQEGWASVHQIQPGAYVDSAESFPASSQVPNYIPAPAVEIEAVPGTPAMLAVRSSSSPSDIYLFSYVDLPDGRKQDAWFRFTFNEKCGTLMAMHSTPEGLLLFWARPSASGLVFRAVDLLPMQPSRNDKPYLDSLRPRANIDAIIGPDEVRETDEGWFMAFDKSTARFLLGGALNDATKRALYDAMPEASSLWAGLPFDAYCIPTNPFARDKNDKAITTGRTVIGKLTVNTKDTGGMAWELSAGGATQQGQYTGRFVGNPLNLAGRIPIASALVSVPIGRETRDYTLKLKALAWNPLNITGVEWVGQSFNRTPRAA